MIGYEIYKVMGNVKIPVETLEDYQRLYDFLGTMLPSRRANDAVEEVYDRVNAKMTEKVFSGILSGTKRTVPTKPPKGKTTNDHLNIVGPKMPDTFSLEDLKAKLENDGWSTASTEAKVWRANLKADMKKNGHYYQRLGGGWHYEIMNRHTVQEKSIDLAGFLANIDFSKVPDEPYGEGGSVIDDDD